MALVPGSRDWTSADRDAWAAEHLTCPSGCSEVEWPVILGGVQQLPDEVPHLLHHRECPRSSAYREPQPLHDTMDPTVHSPTWEHELGDLDQLLELWNPNRYHE